MISFLEFMGFTGKLRNEVGAECANGGSGQVSETVGWRPGESLGFIIFVCSIFIVVILHGILVEWVIL